ncbi:thiazole tautomerase [Thalassobacillus devorans]|uniref:Thiazole tautomerase n=1 Tax=Thalassobacillus devorans TaxID=279813 RepID=A0ABQ1NFY7_9BACI|nr:thiamine phosphate synthase [Thalassobacillus devorans]NIK27212.1 thiazole tautomerase (transcriptional regulator TenI) [Thalassobacillus devorans]GGC75880.1 thiazole tautomerase [Thalassobacillus devorans]
MKLVAVTNGKMETRELSVVLKEIEPLVDSIILREHHLAEADYQLMVEELIASGADRDKVCVHSRPGVARKTGVSNLHLKEKGSGVTEVKQADPFLKVGVSVHSLQAARQAEEEGADYVMFGHVYATDSKKGMAPRGIEELESITSSIDIPVSAIGGITPDRIVEIQEAGAAGVAVMSGIFEAAQPLQAVKRYVKELTIHEGTL